MRDIEELELFRDMSRRTWRAVRTLGTCLPLRPGRTLTEQDRFNSQLFVLVGGRALVRRDGAVVAQLGRGDWFGELTSLRRGGGMATASVTTDGPAEVLVLDAREVGALCHLSPAAAARLERTANVRRPHPWLPSAPSLVAVVGLGRARLSPN